MKWLKRGPGAWGAWLLMKGYEAFLRIIPLSRVAPTGRCLGRILYRFMGSRRRIAFGNMHLAFGSAVAPARKKEILSNLMENLGLTLGELGRPDYLRKTPLARYVAVQGRSYLDAALAGGAGAVLVTAHFGNFPLMLVKLALEGYKVGVIIRDPRHRPMARFLERWRSTFGLISLRDKPRWASVKDALTHLKGNGVLVMHIDLNVSRGGDFVPFFGHWVPTFRGPAMLSLRSGAPALPVFIRRLHGLHHRIVIRPPVTIARTKDREEDIWRLLFHLTRITEETIRRYPQEWWWMHRRFRKERPAAEVGRSIPHEDRPATADL
jgi:KDO2-lipid IV(A) lauroyltransferase